MAQQDKIEEFKAISGIVDTTKAQRYLQGAQWNVELALSNFFDAGELPDENPPPGPAVPPGQVAPVAPPVVPRPKRTDADNSEIDLVRSHVVMEVKGAENVPLRGIQATGRVLHSVADVSLSMRFLNDSKNPLEAIFKFVMEEATVYGFRVTVGEREIVGECLPKDEAFNKYDDALAGGHGGFLLTKGSKRNAFTVNVGNMAPGKDAVVTLNYVVELESEGDIFKFLLPVSRTLFAHNLEANKSSADGKAPSVADGLNATFSLVMNSPITSITSPTHKIEQVIDNIDGTKAEVSLKDGDVGRALELAVAVTEPHRPFAALEILPAPVKSSEEKQPSIGIPEDDSWRKQAAAVVSVFPNVQYFDDILGEIIFLVDRSGSMAGTRMNQAKNALQLFLRSLPEGTMFNIVGFGDKYEKMFPTSRAYNDTTLNEATVYVEGTINSNLGGTEILSPLRTILSDPSDPDFPRQIFLLTDGEVKNTEDVLEYVKKSVGDTRIFTFGIGADADRTLVTGIAKFANGKAEFVRSGERLEGPVMRQLKRALQPVLTQQFSPIFHGDILTVYTFLDEAADLSGIKKVRITAKLGSRDVDFEATLNMEDDRYRWTSETIHTLAAHSLIEDLESEDATLFRSSIIDLGTRHHLVTKFTSFVAVEERGEAVQGEMKKVKVNKAVLGQAAQLSDQIKADQIRRSIVAADTVNIDAEFRSEEPRSSRGAAGGGGYATPVGKVGAPPPPPPAAAHFEGFTFQAAGAAPEEYEQQVQVAPASGPSSSSSFSSAPIEVLAGVLDRAQDFFSGLVSSGESAAPAQQAPARDSNFKARRSSKRSEEKPRSSSLSSSLDEEKEQDNAGSESDQRTRLDARNFSKKANLFSGSDSEDAEAEGLEDADELAVPHVKGSSEDKHKIKQDILAHKKKAEMRPVFDAPAFAAPAGARGPPAPASSKHAAFSAPVIKKTSATRPIDCIIVLAKAGGQFDLTQQLAEAISTKPLAELREAIPAELKAALGLDLALLEQLFATALAVAALETKFVAERDEWELIHGKALRFITKVLSSTGKNVIFTDAGTLVSFAKKVLA